MNINSDSLIIFIIMWGTPAIMLLITYLKMTKEEKNDVIKEFTSSRFIFTIGFLVTGIFLDSLGNLLTLNIMKLLGTPLIIVAGTNIVVDQWKKNKVKSILIALLILVLIGLTIS